MDDDQKRDLHEAITGTLDEGELAVAWVLTVDIAGGDTRYIAHWFGSGHDGTDYLPVWSALGMLRSSVLITEDQVLEMTNEEETGDDDD